MTTKSQISQIFRLEIMSSYNGTCHFNMANVYHTFLFILYKLQVMKVFSFRSQHYDIIASGVLLYTNISRENIALKVFCHPLYVMNNYVLIWGDWLSCDPLRGSHDSQSPHIWR